MATHSDLTDPDVDTDFMPLPPRAKQSQPSADLEREVKSLQAEVEMLQTCLHDSLDLQRSILRRWDQSNKVSFKTPPAQPTKLVPVAVSTPRSPDPSNWRPQYSDMVTPNHAPAANPASRLQSDSLDLNNTTRVLATALHQANLEPPVFAGDGVIHPEDWLQSVNTYKSSLGLTDVQIVRELPRFLVKEPRKWFSVLNTHVCNWTDFCELFRMVFLPADNQERIMRGILDRFQRPEETLPTFIAHMLSEFKKLRSPPSELEQIELICKHALEKYRIALYGTSVKSGIELMLRAHELHTVLGPNPPQPPHAKVKSMPDREAYCFKCSMPGFTSRTCPNCSTAPRRPSQSPRPTVELSQTPPPDCSPDTDAVRPENTYAVAETKTFTRRQGNFQGGRTFRRGNPPPSH